MPSFDHRETGGGLLCGKVRSAGVRSVVGSDCGIRAFGERVPKRPRVLAEVTVWISGPEEQGRMVLADRERRGRLRGHRRSTLTGLPRVSSRPV